MSPESKKREAAAQYEATLILIVISLSMVSIVYSAMKAYRVQPEALFSNSAIELGGTPPLLRLQVNASEPVTLSSLSLDGASSADGILYLASSAEPVSGLVGYWKFDEGSGTFAPDSSGSGNTGALVNSPAWQSQAKCILGSCLSFTSANNQYVQLSTYPSGLASGGAISISTWFKLPSPYAPITGYFVANGVVNVNSGFALLLDSSWNLYFALGSGSGWPNQAVIANSNNYITPGQWYFVVATYDGSSASTIRLYDSAGSLLASGSGTGSVPYGAVIPITIGASGNHGSPAGFANVALDELRIYNGALSAAEISALYAFYVPAAAYGTSKSLCSPGRTTFFSIQTNETGEVRAISDGASWISGSWTSSATLAAGRHEIIFAGGSTCAISLPGGRVITGPDSALSPIPIDGSLNSTAFTVFIPVDTKSHRLLLTLNAGFDEFGI